MNKFPDEDEDCSLNLEEIIDRINMEISSGDLHRICYLQNYCKQIILNLDFEGDQRYHWDLDQRYNH